MFLHMMIVCLSMLVNSLLFGETVKPYSSNPESYEDTGCCPGHDWPRTRRWAGTYSSPNSKRAGRKATKLANRIRRRRDKHNLTIED
jgi:hypothetical protein